MNILDSKIYNSDLIRIIQSLQHLYFPQKKTFFITGATGLICSPVVDVLYALNKLKKLEWKIIAAVRNPENAANRFGKYCDDKNFEIFRYDASKSACFPNGIDYIVHGAGNAYPKAIAAEPVETLRNSIIGLFEILEYARNNKSRVLYVSSSEVYGQLNNTEPIKEEEFGYIEILNPRSSYSIGKCAAETLCASFLNEYSVDSVIVRPGHIYGPTASKFDNRVSSAFMYSASMGQNLVLKSSGKQIRSYCYCLDCASAIITALLNGKAGEAYNISNRNSICSISEMADIFAKSGNVKCIFDIPKNDEKKAFNPMLNSSLNSEKLESLGWNPVFTKQEGFEHSIEICKELMK